LASDGVSDDDEDDELKASLLLTPQIPVSSDRSLAFCWCDELMAAIIKFATEGVEGSSGGGSDPIL
jgi:hypothetical protein